MKKVAKILGFAITSLAFFYLIRICLRLNFSIVHLSRSGSLWAAAVFIIIYGAFFALLAWGWFLILRFISAPARGVPFRDVLGIYFRVNILKYLPGNFMEFVGRNYLGYRYGISNGDIALGSVLETVFLILSSLLVAAVFSLSSLNKVWAGWLVGHGLLKITVVAVCIFSAFVVSIIFVRRMSPADRRHFFSAQFIKIIGILLFINSAVIIWLGLLLAMILVFIIGVPVNLLQGIFLIGAMALSWTCGFITPGAPGGLGVREAALFMLLSTVIAPEPLMIALVLHRLIAIFGDGLVFGVGCLMPLKRSGEVAGVAR